MFNLHKNNAWQHVLAFTRYSNQENDQRLMFLKIGVRV